MSLHRHRRRRRRRRMNLAEELELGPIAKWRRFNIFPFKLVLHCLLIISLSALALVLNAETADLARMMQHNWQHLLYPTAHKNYTGDPRNYMDSTYFLPTADMISHDLNFAVKQYFDLPAQAIDVIQVAGQSGADDLSLPRLDLALYNKGSDDVTDHSWTLSNGSAVDSLPASLVGPSAMQRLHHLRLHMEMRSNDMCPEIINPRSCIQWSVLLTYQNLDDSRVEARLESSPQRCKLPATAWPLSLYLILATGVIAGVYELLVFKAVLRDLRLILLLRRQGGAPRPGSSLPHGGEGREGGGEGEGEGEGRGGGELRSAASIDEAAGDEKMVPAVDITASPPPLSPREERQPQDPDSPGLWSVSFSDASRLLRTWVVVTVISNAFALVYAIVGSFAVFKAQNDVQVLADPDRSWLLRLLLGLSCASTWVGLTQFLEFNPKVYILVRTMNRAGPRVLKYMTAVFPIFFGYTFFGMVVFGSIVLRFSTTRDTAITLFSVLNGDSIRETFLDVLQHVEGWPMTTLAYMYLYSFCCWFIYLVLMCFVAIVEEAFFAAREYSMMQSAGPDRRRIPTHLKVLLSFVRQAQVKAMLGERQRSQ